MTLSPHPAEKHYLHEPIKLTPQPSPRQIQRAFRHLRTQDGTIKTVRVLEPIGQETTSNIIYVITNTLSGHHKPGVTLYLATPVIYEDAAANTSSKCLVTCGLEPVVIKCVPHPPKLSPKACLDNPFSEVAAMQLLTPKNHQKLGHNCDGPSRHVIPLLDSMQDFKHVYLVLPYISGGDLFHVTEETGQGKGIPEEEAISYLRQMAEGLLFMKQKARLAHHDVSLENAMKTSDKDDLVVLIDFGMCVRVPKVKGEATVYIAPQQCCGKPGYIAPEVVREEACDPFAADIWSLGTCLYAMLTGRPLYNSSRDQAFKLMARGGADDVISIYETYGLHVSDGAKELLCRMLHADPTKRITLEGVLKHPFILDGGQQVRNHSH